MISYRHLARYPKVFQTMTGLRLSEFDEVVDDLEARYAAYDSFGRAQAQYDGLGVRTHNVTYNSDGTVTVTDPLTRTTTGTIDERGTLVSHVGPLNSDLEKAYDLNFRPSTVTDPRENATQLTWSGDGVNLTGMANALAQTTGFSYDSLNNLTRTADARGYTTTLAYTGTLLTTTVVARQSKDFG